MIKSRLCDLIGIKYPIIQAGMGPFSNNNLGVAAANAGVLGLLSTSGIVSRRRPAVGLQGLRKHRRRRRRRRYGYCPGKGAETDLQAGQGQGRCFRHQRDGLGGNARSRQVMIDTAIRVREENPDIKKHFKVIFTSAGDPLGWKDKIKGAGFTWMHVVPSVKGALRCKKAGVDVIVASGHEGGFHTSWEPVHSMILLPAVVETVSDKDTLVVRRRRVLRWQDPGGRTGYGRRRRADGDALPGNAGERFPPDLEGRSCGGRRQGQHSWRAALSALPAG